MKIAMVYFNNDKISVGRGAGYIAAIIMQAGHQLTFYDTAYIPLQGLLSDLTTQVEPFDLILFSSTSLYDKQTYNLAVQIKQRASISILLGGIHASILKGQIFKDCPEIDYLCIGEGEEFILEFLQSVEVDGDLSQIQNLAYQKQDGTIIVNSIRPCTDLDTLPVFPFHLFQDRSLVNDSPRAGFCYVSATRGCPYRCTYCCNSAYLDLYPKKYLRTRPIDSVIEELQFLKERYSVKLFYFGDEMILFNVPYVTELFHRIKKDVGVTLGCMFRPECITPEIINLFRETNCRYVGMGVECGDEKFRREFLNRKGTNDQIIHAFAEVKSIPGMFTTSYNMRGYPVSYDDELTKKTKDLNATIKPGIFQCSIFYSFPGTKLHAYCVEHDLISPEKLEQMTKNFQCYFRMSVLRDKPWSNQPERPIT